MTITKADLVQVIANEMAPKISRRDVGRIVQRFLDEMCKALTDGNRIELRGFGILNTKLRKPKIARNPKTKAPVNLPTRRVPVFKSSSILRKMIAKGSSSIG